MDYTQVIILGILQGITEFLPISSSGHLVIAQKLFGIKEPPIFFDILVHFGTLSAVFFYFRKEILGLCLGLARKEKESINFFGLIIIGTVPIAVVGYLLKDSIEVIFNSLTLVGFAYLGMALILFLTRKKMNVFQGRSLESKKPSEGIRRIGMLDAVFIGLFQALAILPGISRSGSTISAGIFRNIDRESAFRFSFFLIIPAVLGALILEISNGGLVELRVFEAGIIGFVVSAFVGFLSLGILRRVLVSRKFFLFGFYCLILGVVILAGVYTRL